MARKAQVIIEYATDESKSLSKQINDVTKFNSEIVAAQGSIAKMEKEMAKLTAGSKEYVAKQVQIAEKNKVIADNLNKIVAAGKDVGKIDLSKVARSQLVSIARELARQMEAIPRSSPQYAVLRENLQRVNTELSSMRAETRGVAQAHSKMIPDLSSAYLAVSAFVVGVTSKIIEATSESLKLKNALIRAFNGDEIRASKVLLEIKQLSSEIGVGINEVTEQFISLQNRGFMPTVESFKGLADIAAFSKKPIDQLVEAILDAQTGEFERLKEFGIKASKEGENVTFKFGAMSKTVALTSDGVKSFFNDLSKDSRVFGAASEQANGFDGALNRLKNAFTQLFANGGSITTWIASFTNSFAKLVDSVAAYGKENLEDTVRKEQLQFQKSIQTLQDATASTNAKTKAIGFLTSHYPELVKNMNLEKATQSELNGLLAKGNAMYLEKIAIAASQDKLLEIEKQFTDKLKEEDAIRERLAQKRQGIGVGKNPTTEDSPTIQLEKQLLQTNQYFQIAYGKLREDEYQRIENRKKRLKDLFGIVDEEVKVEDNGNKAKAKSAKELEKERAKLIKDRLDAALKQAEISYLKESLVNDKAFFDKQKTEEAHNRQEAELKAAHLQKQMSIYQGYLGQVKKGSEEYLQAEIKQFEAEKKLVELRALLARPKIVAPTPIDKLPSGQVSSTNTIDAQLAEISRAASMEEALLQNKFKNLMLNELEFNLQMAQIRKDEADARLAALVASGQFESEQYKKLLKEKADADAHFNNTVVDNEKRTKEIKNILVQDSTGAAQDAIQIGIDLLGQDEAARKKHSAAIKAFEIGQVIASSIAEIAGIWENAEKNPINALIPGWGTIFAGIKTGIAVGRATAATAKIAAQKFAKGGIFGGRSHAQGGTKGYFDDGTHIEVEKDEAFAIVNKHDAPMLRTLSNINSHHGVPYFANGGLFQGNTTPSVNTIQNFQSNSTINIDALIEEQRMTREAIASMPQTLKAYVVVTELEDKQAQIQRAKNGAKL